MGVLRSTWRVDDVHLDCWYDTLDARVSAGSSDGSGFIGSRVCHFIARDATVAWDPLNAHCGFAFVNARSDGGSVLVKPFERTAERLAVGGDEGS